MIPEFESLLSGSTEETSISYCMLFSFMVNPNEDPIVRTTESDDTARRNQVIGQFAKRHSNSLDFTQWSTSND